MYMYNGYLMACYMFPVHTFPVVPRPRCSMVLMSWIATQKHVSRRRFVFNAPKGPPRGENTKGTFVKGRLCAYPIVELLRATPRYATHIFIYIYVYIYLSLSLYIYIYIYIDPPLAPEPNS